MFYQSREKTKRKLQPQIPSLAIEPTSWTSSPKCRLKFAGQPSKFPTERSKIFYAGSYLKDQAYSWFQPLLAAVQNPEEPDPLEFAGFIRLLR